MIVNMLRNAFPDYPMEITHIVAEDDRVAARFRQGGTHDGDLMGIAADRQEGRVDRDRHPPDRRRQGRRELVRRRHARPDGPARRRRPIERRELSGRRPRK